MPHRRAAGTEEDKQGRWVELFEPATLCAVCVGMVVACLQHAVGIESIIYYSTKIFQQAAPGPSPSPSPSPALILALTLAHAFSLY